jgi:hypothetical protein
VKISILLIAVISLAVGAASADLLQWQVKCGLADNQSPYGNDFSTRFGVAPGANWDFDVNDAAHPPVTAPLTDLAWMYSPRYYELYKSAENEGVAPHDVLNLAGTMVVFHWDEPLVWPPPNHGSGDPPTYPDTLLLKDARAPVLTIGEPELWMVEAYAPIKGQTCSFAWEWNQEPGFEVPQKMAVQVWLNPDLETRGYTKDVVLNDWGDGKWKITGIPQWGQIKIGTKYYPLEHDWVIQATLVPEPAVAQLAGLLLGIAGLGIARFRRK